MFTLLIPFHNGDYQRLRWTLSFIQYSSEHLPVSEILLCHNGPPMTDEIKLALERWNLTRAKLLHTDSKGLGAGYKLGIKNATQQYVVLSHSDIPFGWSDIENFLKLKDSPSFVLGSKAHPLSKAMDRPKNRLMATTLFKLLRKIILGLKFPGDSQGTLIIRTDLAQKLVTDCDHDDYLISLELVTHHMKTGGRYIEVPVILHEEIGPSNVRVVKDGIKMLWGMIRLSAKIRWRIPRSAGGHYQEF